MVLPPGLRAARKGRLTMGKNLNDLFPSKWLKSYDLQGHEPVVTIDRIELEAMGRTREALPVVYFRGKAKGLKLNKTIATAIAAIAGSPDIARWPGTPLQLYATTATFGGQAFQVVRVRAPIRSARVLDATQKV